MKPKARNTANIRTTERPFNRLNVTRAMSENAIKHLLIVFVAASLWGTIHLELYQVKLTNLSEFLSLISIFLVTACFANYASSYEVTDISKNWMRILSQTASFSIILLIAILLETLTIAFKIVYPKLYPITLGFTIGLYLSIVLYDFWDFLRCFARRSLDQ